MEFILFMFFFIFTFAFISKRSNIKEVPKIINEKEYTEDTENCEIIDTDFKKKTVPFGYVNFSGKLVRQENLDRHFCPDIRDLKDNFSHTHITVVPEGYVNLNGKLVRHEDLELYQ